MVSHSKHGVSTQHARSKHTIAADDASSTLPEVAEQPHPRKAIRRNASSVRTSTRRHGHAGAETTSNVVASATPPLQQAPVT